MAEINVQLIFQSDSNRQRPPDYDSDIASENQLKDSKIEDLTRVMNVS